MCNYYFDCQKVEPQLVVSETQPLHLKLEKSGRTRFKNKNKPYITLPAYLSQLQGVRNFWHHFSSEMELHVGEYVDGLPTSAFALRM